MATLIAVYNSDGCIGRCDASCYDSSHDKCTCICGGANHGKGKQKATENTRKYCDEWLKQVEHTVSNVPALQLSFFEMEGVE